MLYVKYEELNIVAMLTMYKEILTDFFICIPIIIKTIPIIHMAKFSYNHLLPVSVKNLPNKSNKQNEYFSWRINNPNQDQFYKAFIIFYIFIIAIFIFFLLKYVTVIRSNLLMLHIPYQKMPIGIKFIDLLYWSYTFCKYGLYLFTVIIYTLLLMILTIYPNTDICLMKIEAILYLVPLIGHCGINIISQYHYLLAYSFQIFLLKSSVSFTFVIGQLFIWIYRSKINEKFINPIIVNYPIFMLNSLCFSYLKLFISINYSMNIQYMEFWESHYHYQMKLNNKSHLQKQELILEANQIYFQYFHQKKTHLKDSGFTIMNASYLIVPETIRTKIIKESMNCFCMKTKELKEVYSEMYDHVNAKLRNIHKIILSSKEKRNELLNLLANTEFDDVKEHFDKEFILKIFNDTLN